MALRIRFPWQTDPEPIQPRHRFQAGSPARYNDITDLLSEYQQEVYDHLIQAVTHEDAREHWASIMSWLRPNFDPGTNPEVHEDVLLLSGFLQRAILEYVMFHIEREIEQ